LFLSGTETQSANFFREVPCLQQLVYLADISYKLKEFNLSMQARRTTVLTAEGGVAAVK
jgi:hypothetical protein